MKNFVYISVVLVLLACDNETAWDCIQKEGERGIFEVKIDTPVTRLKVFDDINLILHSSDEQRIELHTGENLLNDIEFVSDTGVVHVFNHNACRWTRSPNNIDLHFYSSDLTFIQKESYAKVWNEDTITHPLTVITYGPGEVELTLNNSRISLQLYSLTNVKLAGKTNSLGCYVNTARDPILFAEELEAINVGITHDGFNRVYVNAVNRLRYRIWNSGDIVAVNEPNIIEEIEVLGSGKLIKDY